MSRVLQNISLYFQCLPIAPGGSMRHDCNMEELIARIQGALCNSGFRLEPRAMDWAAMRLAWLQQEVRQGQQTLLTLRQPGIPWDYSTLDCAERARGLTGWRDPQEVQGPGGGRSATTASGPAVEQPTAPLP